jgi:hypothetical protein
MASPISYVEGQHNTIGAIVDHVLFKKTLHESWWQWFLEQGLWHLRELKLDTWQDVKTELLAVTDRKTVILPDDFIDWVIVGIPVGQYAVSLGLNTQLKLTDRTTSDATVAGLLSQNLPNGLDFAAYGGYHLSNFRGASVPCVGSGLNINKGSFRVLENKTYKELLLDYDFNQTHVYLEYITDGFEPCGETILHPYFCDYVKKGMEFSWEEEKNPSKTEASISRKAKDFRDAYRLVVARKNDLDPQTILNLSRQETRFTPHY